MTHGKQININKAVTSRYVSAARVSLRGRPSRSGQGAKRGYYRQEIARAVVIPAAFPKHAPCPGLLRGVNPEEESLEHLQEGSVPEKQTMIAQRLADAPIQ